MRSKLAYLLAVLVIIIVGTTIFLNRVYLSDVLNAIIYDEPEEILKLEQELELTDVASLIFRASRPELETKENFRNHCSADDADVSVLGCYVGGKIYI